MPLNPQAQGLLGILGTMGAKPFCQMEPAEARDALDMLLGILPPSTAEIAGMEPRTIPGPGGDLPVRVYTPTGAARSRSSCTSTAVASWAAACRGGRACAGTCARPRRPSSPRVATWRRSPRSARGTRAPRAPRPAARLPGDRRLGPAFRVDGLQRRRLPC